MSRLVEELAGPVESALTTMGMLRLRRQDLEPFLPDDVGLPTILSDPPFRLFDAVFYWED